MGRFLPLRRRRDFAEVLGKGRRSSGEGLTIVALARDEPEQVRLGCIVRCRGAVDRNRIKRRVREAIVVADVRGGVDLVVRADGRAKTMEFQEMVRIVRDATDRLDA